MALKDIKGGEVLDFVASVIDPIASIASDEDFVGMLAGKAEKDETPVAAFTRRIREKLPKLITSHKRDLIEIAAACNCMRPDEYEAQMTVGGFLQDIMAIITDEEMSVFLSSLAGTASEQSPGAD